MVSFRFVTTVMARFSCMATLRNSFGHGVFVDSLRTRRRNSLPGNFTHVRADTPAGWTRSSTTRIDFGTRSTARQPENVAKSRSIPQGSPSHGSPLVFLDGGDRRHLRVHPPGGVIAVRWRDP
jgi:hypothetical protein